MLQTVPRNLGAALFKTWYNKKIRTSWYTKKILTSDYPMYYCHFYAIKLRRVRVVRILMNKLVGLFFSRNFFAVVKLHSWKTWMSFRVFPSLASPQNGPFYSCPSYWKSLAFDFAALIYEMVWGLIPVGWRGSLSVEAPWTSATKRLCRQAVVSMDMLWAKCSKNFSIGPGGRTSTSHTPHVAIVSREGPFCCGWWTIFGHAAELIAWNDPTSMERQVGRPATWGDFFWGVACVSLWSFSVQLQGSWEKARAWGASWVLAQR